MAWDVTKYAAIIGIVTVICSVVASYAITRVGVQSNAECIEDHETRIRSVEIQVAQEISAMSSDIDWIRYYVEVMAQEDLPHSGVTRGMDREEKAR